MMDHGGSIRAVAFSPNDRVLALACSDSIVRNWDTTVGPVSECYKTNDIPHGVWYYLHMQTFLHSLRWT